MSNPGQDFAAQYIEAHINVWEMIAEQNREATVRELSQRHDVSRLPKAFIDEAIRARAERIGICASDNMVDAVLTPIQEGNFQEAFTTLLDLAAEIPSFCKTQTFIEILCSLDNKMFNELVNCGYEIDTTEALTLVDNVYRNIGKTQLSAALDAIETGAMGGLIQSALTQHYQALKEAQTQYLS